MILVTPEQMRFLEQISDKNGNTYEMLMENAGKKLSKKILEMLSIYNLNSVIFLCGNGNNAGDCFVAARYIEKNVNCSVCMLCGKPKTDISILNFNRIKTSIIYDNINDIYNILEKTSDSLIVDGVFGTGFHGELPDNIKNVFNIINNRIILAVDVPSGGNCKTGTVSSSTLNVNETMTFGFEKSGMSQYPLRELCGKISVADINISDNYIKDFDFFMRRTELSFIKKVIPKKSPSSHKGNYGKLLTICGSLQMPGACIMALEAAIKTGAGLVQAAVPKEIIPIIAPRLPEIMFFPLETDDNGFITSDNIENLLKLSETATALLIGCGLGVTSGTKEIVREIILKANCSKIIDADGLNCIKDSIDIIKQSKSAVTITPHPAEMSRICNKSVTDIQQNRIDTAYNFSKENNVTVVLKGAGTVIALGNEIFINNTGNPGMAKGGSGDVLAGIIASLNAQAVNNLYAAAAGAYIHGLAGDYAAEKLSQYSMTATDIITNISDVFKTMEN